MKYKLGEFIEAVDERNSQDSFGADSVRGISTDKKFIETKAKLDGVKLTSYKLSLPNTFAYVADTSRRGDKMSLAYNNTDETYLVSSISTVFQVVKSDKLNSDYLYMYFNRPEFDRFARYNSWGSARETFSWDDMCDIDIDLPPLEIQEKYVAVYKSLLANQQAYENGLEDLKVVCDVTLDKFKKNSPYVPVGQFFNEIDERNKGAEIQDVQGININKIFMPSVASSSDLSKYKIVRKGRFAYSSMQTGRDEVIRIALYNRDEPAVISPAYQTLVAADGVLPEYLMMWFSRSESDRYGWFVSDGSIRASLELSRFFEIEIPLPTLELQKSIIEIYNAYTTRRELNEQLKTQIKDICPILINGAIREGKAYAEV